jgi:hypothetical protein
VRARDPGAGLNAMAATRADEALPVRRRPVNVLITVDTEVWPRAENWPRSPLPPDATCAREIDAYFWGGEAAPKLGLPFQLETLAACGLKATFFVDPLFSFALGLPVLERVVRTIEGAQQEVGLHLHPEWLTDSRMPFTHAFHGPYLRDYDEAVQLDLIGTSKDRLAAAGAGPIVAFRAGSWGADTATLRSLQRHGIRFDSSLNACYDASLPDLPARNTLLQPVAVDGLWEFPLTHFVDRPPSGRRELQVCACSLSEFKRVLDAAYTEGWEFVVIVTHSFEFVRVGNLGREHGSVGPMRLLGKRFAALCRYLARHSDRFRTVTFRDLPANLAAPPVQPRPIVSNRARTLARSAGQVLSMLY